MTTPTQKYNKLANKHVLIIGGTSGIGFAVAEACIESSAHVTISSSNSSKLNTALQRLRTAYPNANTNINGFTCDLSTPSLETNIKELFEKTGKVDHIVFTAGDPLAITPLEEHSYESIVKAGHVRFIAPLLVAKVGSKYLTKGPESSIVLTTGSVSLRPMENWSVVAGYAAGLHGMTKNLACDLKPVRVNCVSPGGVATEMWDRMSESGKMEMFRNIGEKVMTGRIGRPEDVAECYLWLMKDSNVTGFVAQTDAGHTLV